MNKLHKISFLFILLLGFISIVNAADLCCVASDTCYEGFSQSDFSGIGACLTAYSDTTYSGVVNSLCENVNACDVVCIEKNSNKELSYQFKWDKGISSGFYTPSSDSVTVLSTFLSDRSSLLAQCEDVFPLCNEDVNDANKRCQSHSEKCTCGTSFLDAGEYCGYNNQKLTSANAQTECVQSFEAVQQNTIAYNFTFLIQDIKDNQAISGVDLRINKLNYKDGTSLYKTFSATTDTAGYGKVKVNANKELASVEYLITKGGFDPISAVYITDPLPRQFSITKKLTQSSVCTNGQERNVEIGSCTFIQTCIYANNNYEWSTDFKEDPDNLCEDRQKTFCQAGDPIIDYTLGEQCVTDEPCGTGRYCDTCICKNIDSEACINNDEILSPSEFCDPSLLEKLKRENGDLSLAFNLDQVQYEPGMGCSEFCTYIPVRVCGNNRYDPGETCEFNIDLTTGQITGIKGDPTGIGNPKCGINDCRPINTSGECTCIVNAFCGNGVLEGSEECDWGTTGWNTPPTLTNGGTCAPGLKCQSGQCACEKPSCPKSINLNLENYTLDVDTLSFSYNLTECDLSELLELNIVYYLADDLEAPISYMPKEFVNITPFYFGVSENIEFTKETNTINYTSNQVLGQLLLEDNSKYCFYLEGKYDTSNYLFSDDTIQSSKICVDIGDSICRSRINESFCYRNQPMYCDEEGNLDDSKAKCDSSDPNNMICKVFERQDSIISDCVEVTDVEQCNYQCGFLFGMFSYYENEYKISDSINGITQTYDCIGDFLLGDIKKECYLDYSNTPVDKFDSCINIESCYNYDSKYACESNICEAEECEWRENPYNIFGEGVCSPVEIKDQDCTVCNLNYMNNKLLSYCDLDTCGSYGENCYYNYENSATQLIRSYEPVGCQDKNNLGCAYINTYNECINFTGTPKNATILTEYNDFQKSSDSINAGTCVWANSKCIKDANNDKTDDCSNYESDFDDYTKCYRDNIPPESELRFGNYVNGRLNYTIFKLDNVYAYDEIKTYWLLLNKSKVDEGNYSRPKNVNINGQLVYDAQNLLSGYYSLFYYSVDLANNLEIVNQKDFYMDTKGPEIDISYDINYYIAKTYFNDELLITFANLTFITSVKEDPLKVVNCSSKLFLEDNETLTEIYPQISINDRYYNYTNPGNDENLLIPQNYPSLPMGMYLLNISCIDYANNVGHESKYIKVSDERISTILPNSTLRSPPHNITVETEYNGSCKLTDESRRGETYNSLSNSVAIEADEGDGTRIHIFYWSSLLDMFGKDEYNDESFVIDKYYIKCEFDEPDHVGELAGDRGDYVQFAVDRTPPKIYNYKLDENNQKIFIDLNWNYNPELGFYAIDEPLVGKYGKFWEAGVSELTLNLSYTDNVATNPGLKLVYPKTYNGCAEPIITGKTQVCTSLMTSTDLNEFLYTGLYDAKILAIDSIGNPKTETLNVKVDNEDYYFQLLLNDKVDGMLNRDSYDVTLVPTKNIEEMIDKLDENYTINVLALQVFTEGRGTLLKNIYLNPNNNSENILTNFTGRINLTDFRFEGLNNVAVYFDVVSVDSHNITSLGIINAGDFLVDTVQPSEAIFTTLFEDIEREIQYKDLNGNEYSLYYYNGKYYTNEDELVITGIADTDSRVVFSWNQPYNNNDSYNLYTQNTQDKLNNTLLIYTGKELDGTSNIVYLDKTSAPLLDFYLEFKDVTRDAYDYYDVRYKIIAEVPENQDYRKIILEDAINILNLSATNVELHTQPIDQNSFRVPLSIPNGCNDLYYRTIDVNSNVKINTNKYFTICKDKLPPILFPAPDGLSPSDNSINSVVDRDVTIKVSDGNGIVTESVEGYAPLVFVNEEPQEISINGEGNAVAISYHNTEDGQYNVLATIYDYAHNSLELDWNFILDGNAPENPSYTFDVDSYEYGDDKELYFLQEKPSEIGIDFTLEINRTILGLNISDESVFETPYNFKGLSYSWVIPENIGLILIPNNEYDSEIDIIKHADDQDLTLDHPYSKKIVIDSEAPIIGLEIPNPYTIGIDYSDDETFDVVFNISNENYFPESIFISLSGLPKEFPSTFPVEFSDCTLQINYYRCVYKLQIKDLEDETEYYYNVSVYDKAQNFAESETRKLILDRELPDIDLKFEGDNNVTIVDNIDYLVYPHIYTFKITSSKMLNSSTFRILFKVNNGNSIESRIYEEDVWYEDRIGDTFYFRFNLSKYDIIAPYNKVVGDISFEITVYDENGNYLKDLKANYTSSPNRLKLYSKTPESPKLKPIFHLDNDQPLDSTNPEISDRNYPLYYYEGIYYTNENGIMHITGTADSIGHTLKIYEEDSYNVLAEYTTSEPEIFTYSGKTIFGGGKKGENFVIVQGKFDLSNYDLSLSDNPCVFFSNHYRKDYGYYMKGYPIGSLASEDHDSNKKIVFKNNLEVDVPIGTSIEIGYGECKEDSTYFDLQLNLSTFADGNIDLKLKDTDSFNQFKYYYLGTLKKDTRAPTISNRNPDIDQIIVEQNKVIKFTVCDDSPGILGAENPDGRTHGTPSNFKVTLDDSVSIKQEQEYIRPIYVNGNLYCYNFTSENIDLSISKHKITVHSIDFAHNENDEEYNFIVDPLSPMLGNFSLSESSNEIFEYDTGLKTYQIYFTRSNNPEIYIDFADADKVDFYEVKLNKIVPYGLYEANAVFEKINYNTIHSDNSFFKCERNLEKSLNSFTCKINTTLSLDYIYRLDFRVNKTVEINGVKENKISPVNPPFQKHFVFDNVLEYEGPLEIPAVTQSRAFQFDVITKELFGLIPEITIKGNSNDGTHNFYSSVVSNYEGRKNIIFDTELMNLDDTVYPSGRYDYSMSIKDFAGNENIVNGSIEIDDEFPVLLLDSIQTTQPETDKIEFGNNTESLLQNTEELSIAFGKKIRFKKAELLLKGTIRTDENRNFVDTNQLILEFREKSLSGIPGAIVDEYNFSVCNSACATNNNVFLNTVGERESSGCICRETESFQFIITSDKIPMTENSEIDSYIQLIPIDEAENSRIYRAFILRDFKPPKAPLIDIS